MKNKVKTFNEFVQYEYGTSLNEAFASTILRDVKNQIDSKNYRSFKQTLGHMKAVQWDKIEDDDFIRVDDVKEARSKKYENALIFWFDSNDNFNYVTTGKHTFDHGRGWGRRYKTPSVLAVSKESAYALILTEDVLKEYGSDTKRIERMNAKRDALALKSNQEVAEENDKRYKELIAKKQLDQTDLGPYFEDIMEYHFDLFKGFVDKDWSDLRKLINQIKKILDMAENYADIKKGIDRGTFFKHQGKQLKNIEESVLKFHSDYVKPHQKKMEALDK